MKNLILGLLLLSAMARANECAEGVRLNEVNSITISLTETLSYVNGSGFINSLNTDHRTYDDSISGIYFINGSFINSGYLAKIEIGFQRIIEVNIQNKFINKSSVQPFSCNSYDILSANFGRNKILFGGNCPITSIETARSIFDPRSSTFTIASLQYNLGKQFTVHAQCD